MSQSPGILVASLAIFLSSCTAAGSEYPRPGIAPPAQFSSTSDRSAVEENWWRQFHDPLLTALLEAARGGRLPEGALTGSVTSNRLSEEGQIPVGNIPGFERDFTLFDAGFDASWEIDLWGRDSNNIKARANDLAEKQELQRSVLLSAIAETAAAYVDLRSAEASAHAIAGQAKALQIAIVPAPQQQRGSAEIRNCTNSGPGGGRCGAVADNIGQRKGRGLSSGAVDRA
mgnify:CR=1 FL=1